MIDTIPDYQQPEISPDIARETQHHIESLSLLGYTVLFNAADFLKGQRKGRRARLRWDGEAFSIWT
jgi:hypothetical protein